jgi:hypothetical protein
MDVFAIVHLGPCRHGDAVPFGQYGDVDELCAFCGDTCAAHSHHIRGEWKTRPPGAPDVIASCDECFELHHLDEYGNGPNMLIFLDGHISHTFVIANN